jgi:hypothetical protein
VEGSYSSHQKIGLFGEICQIKFVNSSEKPLVLSTWLYGFIPLPHYPKFKQKEKKKKKEENSAQRIMKHVL